MANDAPVKPLELSRYCVPFTPFRGRLDEAMLCVVSTAGVRQKQDKPFDTEGDSTYRVISGGALGAG